MLNPLKIWEEIKDDDEFTDPVVVVAPEDAEGWQGLPIDVFVDRKQERCYVVVCEREELIASFLGENSG
jgi:hypothetical protein